MIAFHKYGKTFALTAAALFAAGITLSTPEPAQAASKTGNFLLGAAAGAAGLAVIHSLNKNRRRTYAQPAPRRYYRRAPSRRYYKPRVSASPVTMKVQESLNILGFHVGAVDGRSGPATRAGARQFQMSISQPATGYLTELQKGILFQKAQAILTGVPANPAPAVYPAAAAAPAYAQPPAAPAYAPPPAPAYAQPPAAPAYAPPPAPAAPAYIPPPPIQPAPVQ